MTIKVLLEKLDGKTITDEELIEINPALLKLFSPMSKQELLRFQAEYHLEENKSWEDFYQRQCKTIAELIRLELTLPNDIRKEADLPEISMELDLNTLV